MKLTLPPLEIGETEGFSDEKDIFGRKRYGENLLSLINKTDDELVIAIDAPWGQGKSTFIKMWRGHLLNEGFQSIYFDAFENDYQADPFLAISSEIYSLIKDDSKKTEFKKKAVNALKIISATALKIGVNSATAGLVNFPSGSNQDASSAASDIYTNYLDEKITNAQAEKQSIAGFKSYLEELSKTLADGKKLIFVIDELDRCKPKFALAIIESIKHLFSTRNLCFVLVVNRDQLEESVRHEYGNNIDASGYLTKFITLWNTLPKNLTVEQPDTLNYLKQCSASMNFSFDQLPSDLMQVFGDINDCYDLSFRDIERALSNFSLFINTHIPEEGYQHKFIHVLYWILSVIKLKNTKEYSKIINSNFIDIRSESKLLNLPLRYFFGREVNLALIIMDRFSSNHDTDYMIHNGLEDRLSDATDWHKKYIGLSGFGRILNSISINNE